VSSKPDNIFTISVCPFILACIGSHVCKISRILIAAHKIKIIANPLSGPTLTPVNCALNCCSYMDRYVFLISSCM
jgi:hypothetical protein